MSLGSIDFWFMADGARVHKTVHHFLMHATTLDLSDADAEVDEVAWYIAPRLCGGGRPSISGLPLPASIELKNVQVLTLGDNVCFTGQPVWPAVT
jgi:hypothetical protein